MFKGANVIRLIPDGPNKGGSNSGVSTFTKLLDIRTARNIWVYQGRWQKTPSLSSYGPLAFGNPIRSYSLHNYMKYSITNAALGPVSRIMTHDKYAGDVHQINKFDTDNTGPTTSYTPIRIVTSDGVTPAVFSNIKNRAFVSWSGTNSFIYDGLDVNYAQLAGGYDLAYDIGVDGPVTAPTYQLSGDLSAQGVPYGDTAAGDFSITTTNGSNTVNIVDFNFFGPVVPTDTTAIKIGGVVYPLVSPGGVTNYAATVMDPTTPKATNVINTHTVTIVGYLFPPDGAWNGLQIDLGSPSEVFMIESYTLGASDTTVTTVDLVVNAHTDDPWTLTGTQLTLQSAYQGGSVSQTALITAYNGDLNWTSTGPQYAYAYYDPLTGHVSNVSPVLQITEQNQIGVFVVLDDIMPSRLEDQVRFTEIMIFRTQLDGGAVLYPLGTFGYPPTFDTISNVLAAPLSFPDNHTDAQLLINGGLIAPLVNNAKPSAATHMMYYDQRVWLNPVNDPTAIIFSGDYYQVPFGVAEESFPALNLLRISSEDGRVRGMRLVGNQGQIMTDRYSYVIVGGPDSLSYRLIRIGRQTYGVGDYQMEELPGDIGDNSSALVYLSRDRREYVLAPSYGNVPLTDPVSDVFANQMGTVDEYYDTRIAYFPAPNIRLLISTLTSSTMVFNFDSKTWCQAESEFNAGVELRPQGYATIYGGANPVDLFVVHNGIVYAWMRDSSTGPVTAYLETPPMDFGEKRRKRINFVRVYTNAPACNVGFTVDESTTTTTIPAVTEPDPLYSIYATPSSPVDDPGAKELVAFTLAGVSSGTMLVSDGFRHTIRVTLPVDTTRYDIYAIDIGFTVIDNDGEVVG